MSNLFLVNPGTLIQASAVASIELHPDGKAMVFLTNGKAYSLSSAGAAELVSMLKEDKDDYE